MRVPSRSIGRIPHGRCVISLGPDPRLARADASRRPRKRESMNESGPLGPSGPGDPKRRLFSSKRPASPSLGDPRLEEAIQASHQAIAERFEESLQAVAENALSAMREVAEEIWHSTGAEVKDLKERILRDLSREQAIRGLVAHSDERFQAIDLRVARIEEGMWRVDRAATAIVEALSAGSADAPRTLSTRIRAPPGTVCLNADRTTFRRCSMGTNWSVRTHSVREHRSGG